MVDPSLAPTAVPRLAGLDERYQIHDVLGTGGKATVYLADDRLLTRRVAVKVFRARAETPEALREQETEAKVIASLNHFALTTLFDAGVDASDPARPQIYLVMEHIDGGDLKRRLQQGALGWFQACWLGRDLAEGLHYLHRSGFLHRDIKPANVLLASHELEVRPRAKLADFGIASLVGRRDGGDEVTGTAAYLSPEQVEGEPPTEASDTYSLGLVLLEAVTGRVAFPGGIEQSAFARLDRDPEIPSSLPRRVQEALGRMTARRPADRPDLGEVAALWQDLLIDELVRQRGFAAVAPEDDGRAVSVAARYDILDTPSEESFDRVTRLAARLVRAPICVISIRDDDRVWLKSSRGLDQAEFSRNVAFCASTDPGGGTWTVADTLADARTAASPVVTGAPHIRSFAAAPLVTWDGHTLGSLCACDTRPRLFSDEDLLTLTELAAIVLHEIDLRLASRRALFDR